MNQLKIVLCVIVAAAFVALYFWSTSQYSKGYQAGYTKRSEETIEAMQAWEKLQQARFNFVKKTSEDLAQEYQRKNKDFEEVKKNADQELKNLLLAVDMQRSHIVRLNSENGQLRSSTDKGAIADQSTRKSNDGAATENVARECASTLVEVAADAEQLKDQVAGLQRFVRVAEAACQ